MPARFLAGWFALATLLALVVFGCSSSETTEEPPAPKKELTLRGEGTRVAVAVGDEARTKLGIDWLEARLRPLGTSTDRKGVATIEPGKSGLALDFVAHDKKGTAIAEGFVGLDLNGLTRVKPKSANHAQQKTDLVFALDNAEVVRLTSKKAAPSAAQLTKHERGVIVASVLESFAGGGKAPSELGIDVAASAPSTKPQKKTSSSVSPRTLGQEDGAACEMPKTEPDGCFHEVCSVTNPALLDSFRQAITDTLKGVLTTPSCVEFGVGAAATIADAFIVIDGPLEMFLGGKTAELALECLKDTAIALVENLVKTPLLDALKNFLCSSRDAALPSLPALGGDLGLGQEQSLIVYALDKMKVDVSKDLDIPFGETYDAVKDVFDTARSCTCGVASKGAKPMRVVDAQGRIACVPCAAGTHYDEGQIACVPDDPNAVITMCTAPNNPNAGKTVCGEATPEVLLVKHDLCMDVYVREYTPEQARSGTIPAARIETVRLPDPVTGGTWSSPPSNLATSYASCISSGADPFESAEEEGYANDGSPGTTWVTTPQMHLPGHSCSKDASGGVTCIDVTPYEYVPDLDETGRVAPGFYWCGFQGSKCKDSGGRPVVDFTRQFPLYYPIGYGTDTCTSKPGNAPDNGPARAEDVMAVDSCAGRADGVYCSNADRASGVKCEGGLIRALSRCEPGNECKSAPAAAALECGPSGPKLTKGDCSDKPDGWWCLDDGSGATWMAYCAGKQIQGGCSCKSCKEQGVRATCSAAPPPAACPG